MDEKEWKEWREREKKIVVGDKNETSSTEAYSHSQHKNAIIYLWWQQNVKSD